MGGDVSVFVLGIMFVAAVEQQQQQRCGRGPLSLVDGDGGRPWRRRRRTVAGRTVAMPAAAPGAGRVGRRRRPLDAAAAAADVVVVIVVVVAAVAVVVGRHRHRHVRANRPRYWLTNLTNENRNIDRLLHTPVRGTAY